jgi:hypothetical protein
MLPRAIEFKLQSTLAKATNVTIDVNFLTKLDIGIWHHLDEIQKIEGSSEMVNKFFLQTK